MLADFFFKSWWPIHIICRKVILTISDKQINSKDIHNFHLNSYSKMVCAASFKKIVTWTLCLERSTQQVQLRSHQNDAGLEVLHTKHNCVTLCSFSSPKKTEDPHFYVQKPT